MQKYRIAFRSSTVVSSHSNSRCGGTTDEAVDAAFNISAAAAVAHSADEHARAMITCSVNERDTSQQSVLIHQACSLPHCDCDSPCVERVTGIDAAIDATDIAVGLTAMRMVDTQECAAVAPSP